MLTNDFEYHRALDSYRLENLKIEAMRERLRRGFARPGEIERATQERLAHQEKLRQLIAQFETRSGGRAHSLQHGG